MSQPLHRLLSSPFSPSTYLRLLESCVLNKDLLLGSQIHSKILIDGLKDESFLSSKLITFYSLSGDLPAAESIFSSVQNSNVFHLNSMIRAFSCNGLYQKAVDLFHQKRREGVQPNSCTFSCVLKASASLADLSQGKRLHKLAMDRGFESDIFVSNSLIFMYSKCNRLEDGVKLFNKMPKRDIVSWNSIISAYALNGFGFDSVTKVREMVRFGLKPDHVTVISVLALPSIAEVDIREFHGYVSRNGYDLISKIRNALVSAYGKRGRTVDARRVFESSVEKDRVTWNAMISCYAQNGLVEESMELLRDMKASGLVAADVVTYSGIISSLSQTDRYDEATLVFLEMLGAGLKPDVVAIASVLPAITGALCLHHCKEIHAYSYRHTMELDRRVRNALISVYCKCSSIRDAERVFEATRTRDVISWSSMIVGYSQNQYFVEALETFRLMIRAEMAPNPITVTGVLSACASVSGLSLGKEIHLWAIRSSFEGQSFVGSALVDMYAKCGRIGDSRRVFDLMEEKNLVTQNSMIGGYGIHGLVEEALEMFRAVREPDHVSFIAALSACRHGGLVEEGIKILNSMKDFGVRPREGHYACVVDLLGRSGRLGEALDLVRTLPMEPSTEIWGALLGACKIHSNSEIGMYTGERIVELGSGNPGYYVLLSNILADCGRWGDVEVVREGMKERGVKKGAGCSWIQVDKEVYSFVAKQRTQHPEWESLFWVLSVLNEQMRGLSC